eukprot:gb/GEZN01000079.1/.p1 GENE.gb/GEZN01000079.1/~~gb/GEZN01000079.1/.p1  ORF type:complete len:2376 (-),score=247.87 gb/GEZN01000079.1/:553-6798(-)
MPYDWPLVGNDGGQVEAGVRFSAEVIECFEWAYAELGLLNFTSNYTVADANISVLTALQYPLFDFSSPPFLNFTIPVATMQGACLEVLHNETDPEVWLPMFELNMNKVRGNASVALNDHGKLIMSVHTLQVDQAFGAFYSPPIPLDSHTLTLLANDMLSNTIDTMNDFFKGNAPELPAQLYKFIPNPQLTMEVNYFFIYMPYKPLSSVKFMSARPGSAWNEQALYTARFSQQQQQQHAFQGWEVGAGKNSSYLYLEELRVNVSVASSSDVSVLATEEKGAHNKEQLSGWNRKLAQVSTTSPIIEPSQFMVLGQPFIIYWNKSYFSEEKLAVQFYNGSKLITGIYDVENNGSVSFTPTSADFTSPSTYMLSISDSVEVHSVHFEMVRLLSKVFVSPNDMHVVRTFPLCLSWDTGDSHLGAVSVSVWMSSGVENVPVATLATNYDNNGTGCWTLPAEVCTGTYIASVLRVSDSGKAEPFVPSYSKTFSVQERFAVRAPTGCTQYGVDANGGTASIYVKWWPGQAWNHTLHAELWVGEVLGERYDNVSAQQLEQQVIPRCFQDTAGVCYSSLGKVVYRIWLSSSSGDGAWSDFFAFALPNNSFFFCPPPSSTLPLSTPTSQTSAELRFATGSGTRTASLISYSQKGSSSSSTSFMPISSIWQHSFSPAALYEPDAAFGDSLGFQGLDYKLPALSFPAPNPTWALPSPRIPIGNSYSGPGCQFMGSWMITFGKDSPYKEGNLEIYPNAPNTNTYYTMAVGKVGSVYGYMSSSMIGTGTWNIQVRTYNTSCDSSYVGTYTMQDNDQDCSNFKLTLVSDGCTDRRNALANAKVFKSSCMLEGTKWSLVFADSTGSLTGKASFYANPDQMGHNFSMNIVGKNSVFGNYYADTDLVSGVVSIRMDSGCRSNWTTYNLYFSPDCSLLRILNPSTASTCTFLVTESSFFASALCPDVSGQWTVSWQDAENIDPQALLLDSPSGRNTSAFHLTKTGGGYYTGEYSWDGTLLTFTSFQSCTSDGSCSDVCQTADSLSSTLAGSYFLSFPSADAMCELAVLTENYDNCTERNQFLLNASFAMTSSPNIQSDFWMYKSMDVELIYPTDLKNNRIKKGQVLNLTWTPLVPVDSSAVSGSQRHATITLRDSAMKERWAQRADVSNLGFLTFVLEPPYAGTFKLCVEFADSTIFACTATTYMVDGPPKKVLGLLEKSWLIFVFIIALVLFSLVYIAFRVDMGSQVVQSTWRAALLGQTLNLWFLEMIIKPCTQIFITVWHVYPMVQWARESNVTRVYDLLEDYNVGSWLDWMTPMLERSDLLAGWSAVIAIWGSILLAWSVLIEWYVLWRSIYHSNVTRDVATYELQVQKPTQGWQYWDRCTRVQNCIKACFKCHAQLITFSKNIWLVGVLFIYVMPLVSYLWPFITLLNPETCPISQADGGDQYTAMIRMMWGILFGICFTGQLVPYKLAIPLAATACYCIVAPTLFPEFTTRTVVRAESVNYRDEPLLGAHPTTEDANDDDQTGIGMDMKSNTDLVEQAIISGEKACDSCLDLKVDPEKCINRSALLKLIFLLLFSHLLLLPLTFEDSLIAVQMLQDVNATKQEQTTRQIFFVLFWFLPFLGIRWLLWWDFQSEKSPIWRLTVYSVFMSIYGASYVVFLHTIGKSCVFWGDPVLEYFNFLRNLLRLLAICLGALCLLADYFTEPRYHVPYVITYPPSHPSEILLVKVATACWHNFNTSVKELCIYKLLTTDSIHDPPLWMYITLALGMGTLAVRSNADASLSTKEYVQNLGSDWDFAWPAEPTVFDPLFQNMDQWAHLQAEAFTIGAIAACVAFLLRLSIYFLPRDKDAARCLTWFRWVRYAVEAIAVLACGGLIIFELAQPYVALIDWSTCPDCGNLLVQAQQNSLTLVVGLGLVGLFTFKIFLLVATISIALNRNGKNFLEKLQPEPGQHQAWKEAARSALTFLMLLGVFFTYFISAPALIMAYQISGDWFILMLSVAFWALPAIVIFSMLRTQALVTRYIFFLLVEVILLVWIIAQLIRDTGKEKEILDMFLTPENILDCIAEFAVEYTLANIVIIAIVNVVLRLGVTTQPEV